MYRRWPSAWMVSKARDDFPLPLMPVKTTSLPRGISRSMFCRLCSRAPNILIFAFGESGVFCTLLDGDADGVGVAGLVLQFVGGEPGVEDSQHFVGGSVVYSELHQVHIFATEGHLAVR